MSSLSRLYRNNDHHMAFVCFTIIFIYVLLLMHSLGTIVLFGKFLVPKKLGVHSLGRNKLASLGLLDSVSVSLVRIIMRTGILLLLIYRIYIIYSMLETTPKRARERNGVRLCQRLQGHTNDRSHKNGTTEISTGSMCPSEGKRELEIGRTKRKKESL
jgi:hypothetical protein